MNWALLILYLLIAMSWGITFAKHDELRPNYNVFHYTFDVMVTLILVWWALGWTFI